MMSKRQSRTCSVVPCQWQWSSGWRRSYVPEGRLANTASAESQNDTGGQTETLPGAKAYREDRPRLHLSAGGVAIVVTITMTTTAEKVAGAMMCSPWTDSASPILAKMR